MVLYGKNNNPPAEDIVHAKPAIMLNNVWPNVISANKRIDEVKF